MFERCPNILDIKPTHCEMQVPINFSSQCVDCACDLDHLGCNVLKHTKYDTYFSPSIQDNVFLKIMEGGGSNAENNFPIVG